MKKVRVRGATMTEHRLDPSSAWIEVFIPAAPLLEIIAILSGLCLERANAGCLAFQDGGELVFHRAAQGGVTRTGKRFEVSLAEQELEYVLSFLLDCWLAGRAPVDHVDLELNDGKWVLMLRVENSVPPMSSDDARRELGL